MSGLDMLLRLPSVRFDMQILLFLFFVGLIAGIEAALNVP